MVLSNELVADIIALKQKHGFPVGDVLHELCRAINELDEAKEAFNNINENPLEFSEELADALIFILAAAKFAKVDLEKAIYAKVEKNKSRCWS